VRILTMHKAKGLQFPVVVLADLAGRSHAGGTKFVVHGDWQLRFAQRRTRGFDEAVALQNRREEAEEIRLLYVAATRAQRRLIIPWFAEKGERLDLLRRGFEPVESRLVEVDYGVRRLDAALPLATPVARDNFQERRRIWQTEHAALLKRAAQPMARRSPSKLAGEHEPFHEQEPGEVTARERAIEIGVAVHAELAGLPVIATLSAEEQQRVHALVARALQSELMARVQRAAEVYRELPFALVLPDGALLEGKLDLLFREGHRWVLVDYKTDGKPAPEKYREQMQAYADALLKTAGIEVAESLLFFLATGTVTKLS
jgi:ATP-dependent exoDNAse (exonuclease V) beta subunit